MCGCLKHSSGWSDLIFLVVAFGVCCLIAYVGYQLNDRDTSYFAMPFIVMAEVGLIVLLLSI